MLEFRAVEKSFGADPILAIGSQTLDTGIYWLQGPNGAGKTTLLRIIAGILPFRGDILLKGHRQPNAPTNPQLVGQPEAQANCPLISLRKDPVGYRRLVAWADAEPLYPGFLTGEDLLKFYSDILRPEPRQITDLTQQFGVAAWLGTRLATWSSGMAKRFSLLLAFLGRPALILLDEPLVTLDQSAVSILVDLIQASHRHHGTGFLLTSHQPLPLTNLRKILLKNKSILLTDN